MSAEGEEVTQASSGQVVTTVDGVLPQVLGPPQTATRTTPSDLNDASVVLRLVYRDVSFLLAADMPSETESVLLAGGALVDSDVLKVSYHGSRSASSEEFLDAVTPAATVISAGEGNRFGHPHPEVIDALRRRIPNGNLFVTSDSGDVEFVTDGRSLTVRTER